MKTLEQVLADLREEAAVLRANGHAAQAQTLERALDEVRESANDYLAWISESEAILRSGKGLDYLRSRRAAWAEDGAAEQRNGRRWFYRRVVVPRRTLSSIAREEASREAAS